MDILDFLFGVAVGMVIAITIMITAGITISRRQINSQSGDSNK